LAGYGAVKLRSSTAGMANEEAPIHLVLSQCIVVELDVNKVVLVT